MTSITFATWQAEMRKRYRNHDDRCPTCGASYGLRVDDPNRCGVCITGLSLDGNPITPVMGDDGVMRCPTCLALGATCDLIPHDEWPDAWSHDVRLPERSPSR
jgi:hypothetical protein